MNRKVGCYFQILGDMYSTLQYTIVYYSIYIAIYHSLLVYQPTFLNILAKPRALEALSLISTNSSLKLRQESPMASLRGGGTISELYHTTVVVFTFSCQGSLQRCGGCGNTRPSECQGCPPCTPAGVPPCHYGGGGG